MNELRTFETASEMRAFYRELFERRKRLMAPPPPPSPPPPPEPPSPPEPPPPVVVPVTAAAEPVVMPVTFIPVGLPGTVIPSPDLIRIIIRQAAVVLDLPAAAFMSERRIPLFARARQVTYFIARKLTGASLSTLGRSFKRDHSTVLYGWRKAVSRKRDDPQLAQKIEWIIERVKFVVAERDLLMPRELTDEEVLHVGTFPNHWRKKPPQPEQHTTA